MQSVRLIDLMERTGDWGKLPANADGLGTFYAVELGSCFLSQNSSTLNSEKKRSVCGFLF